MARKKVVSAPVKRVGLTSARYDGTGLRPRTSGAGRLTSAPSAAEAEPPSEGKIVDITEAVTSSMNEAATDTKPEEGTDG